MKQKVIKIACWILVLTMVFGININTYYAEDEPAKQEVVYANLLGDGSVGSVYVVNIVQPDGTGLVTDFGEYTQVRNMSTTDKINVDGDKVTVKIGEEKLYYEGMMKSADLPWDFDISYFADGKKLSADEMVGKTGSVEIVLDVTKNPQANSCFYENMTLQISVTLDSDICKNIKANGASIANIGRKKQLAFMLLPGKEHSYSITADAQGFEMDGILINAVMSDIDVDVDDSGILGDVNTLQDATSDLNEGAGELEDGLYDLKQAVGGDIIDNLSKLKSGSADLESNTGLLSGSADELNGAAAQLLAGAQEMQGGFGTLSTGLDDLGAGLDELAGQSVGLTEGSGQVYAALLQIQTALSSMPAPADVSQLTASSTQILDAINQLTTAAEGLKNGVDYDTYIATLGAGGLKSGNESTIAAINNQISSLSASPGNEETIAVLTAAINMLASNNGYIDGTKNYFNTLETNAAQLHAGLVNLQTKYGQFDAALQSAAAELASLPDSLAQLSASVDTLVTQYAGLNSGISDYTEGVALALAGCTAAKNGLPELVAGSTALTQGLTELSSGTAQMSAAALKLKTVMSTFDNGMLELTKGMNELSSGIDELYDGSEELKDGTQTLDDEAQDMDSTLTDEIDGIMDSISGNPDEIISFVSDKNTNVTAVQFVIKTPSVTVPETEHEAEQPIEEKTFWQKLMMLFGID